jgi:putative transposase
MPESRPGTYAITSVTYERRSIFQVDTTAQLFLDTLQHYRREGHFKLHAFVVMPDHIHLLITPQKITLERAVGMIKGGFSHHLGAHFTVWQEGFRDRRCRDAEEFRVKREYIHMNPVRAGLVLEPHHFRYSSAFRAATNPSG